MPKRLVKVLGLIGVAIVFTAVLWLLQRQLKDVDYRDILRRMRETPEDSLLVSVFMTALSYGTLTVYDYMGLRYSGKPLTYKKTAFASFVAYVFSHNIGLSMFGGLAFRYRIYSAWNLTAVDVAKVTVFCGVTFWLGLLTLGGVIFALIPPPSLAILPVPTWAFRVTGVVFLLLATLYIGLCLKGNKQLRLFKWQFALPSGGLAIAQTSLATLDWFLASTALFAVMPSQLHIGSLEFLSVYMLASVAGLLAHVPAGLGVVETVMVMALSDQASPEAILGSLLVFRGVYYLAPLGVALVFMGAYEIANATGVARGITLAAKRWFEAVVPRMMSVLVFATGVVLLFSGAMPAIETRRQWLEDVLPLAFVEASHLLGSITGAALLIVARGLQKRLDGAYLLTCVLLIAGICFSIIKGVDYEEAIILSLALLLVAPCRSYFYRKASLLEARFSLGWLIAIGLSLLSMIWLVAFANKHVEYSRELWWSFTFGGDAPRSLRAALGAVAGSLLALIIYLMRPPGAPESVAPLQEETKAIVEASKRTYAHLALLGDKAILMNQKHTAFIMYAVEGRSWIAMGEPVGPSSDHLDLIWRFRDLVDRYGGWPVFYQVDQDSLSVYVDAGFTLLKIGEEAVIDLNSFSLDGKSFKHLRNVNNRLIKEGWQLEVLPSSEVEGLMPELSRISSEWLKSKNAREKRFSLGFFSEDYIDQTPVAVVRREGSIAAFANLWLGAQKSELSVDLMRYDVLAPAATMDFLFVQLMLWGQSLGYQTFNLGMAPFSGMASRPLAPLWSRLGAKLYEHGERFYNFQGLREYKEKYHPSWRSKYLASPSTRVIPMILANVATLIAGGIKGAMPR